MKDSIPAQAIQSKHQIWSIPNEKGLFKQHYEKFLKEKGWVDLQVGSPLRKFFPK